MNLGGQFSHNTSPPKGSLAQKRFLLSSTHNAYEALVIYVEKTNGNYLPSGHNWSKGGLYLYISSPCTMRKNGPEAGDRKCTRENKRSQQEENIVPPVD